MKEGRLQLIKDVLFPKFCVRCNSEGEFLCKQCLHKLQVNLICLCPICHKLSWQGQPCIKCRVNSHLDGVSAFFSYDEKSIVAKLLKKYKYDFAYDMENTWQGIFCKAIKMNEHKMYSYSSSGCKIIPVPLFARRKRMRGFNQSELFASIIQQILGIPIEDCLQRIKNTKQQARLTSRERRQNLAGAFCIDKTKKAPKRALLIDDVFTTGSTMQECAKLLKQNGTEQVFSLVLARG